jgi:predicted DCC family thiol-disulfide oxidoreductase YuxK
MPSISPEPARPGQGLTVLYDGACPLCSREIDWYRRSIASAPICWLDVAHCEDAALPRGIDRAAALRRFHVLEADGRPATGAAAFLRLWSAYPRLARYVHLARLPGVLPFLERVYRLFLRLRPMLARNLPKPRPREGDLP